MDSKTYKRELSSLGPVALKQGQTEVCAPGHETWGLVTCDACGAKFELGPNRIHGSLKSEQECVKQLEGLLARTTTSGRPI